MGMEDPFKPLDAKPINPKEDLFKDIEGTTFQKQLTKTLELLEKNNPGSLEAKDIVYRLETLGVRASDAELFWKEMGDDFYSLTGEIDAPRALLAVKEYWKNRPKESDTPEMKIEKEAMRKKAVIEIKACEK